MVNPTHHTISYMPEAISFEWLWWSQISEAPSSGLGVHSAQTTARYVYTNLCSMPTPTSSIDGSNPEYMHSWKNGTRCRWCRKSNVYRSYLLFWVPSLYPPVFIWKHSWDFFCCFIRGVGAEHEAWTRCGEMLLMLVVDWQAPAVRGEEVGCFCNVAGASIVGVGGQRFVIETLMVDSRVA